MESLRWLGLWTGILLFSPALWAGETRDLLEARKAYEWSQNFRSAGVLKGPLPLKQHLDAWNKHIKNAGGKFKDLRLFASEELLEISVQMPDMALTLDEFIRFLSSIPPTAGKFTALYHPREIKLVSPAKTAIQAPFFSQDDFLRFDTEQLQKARENKIAASRSSWNPSIKLKRYRDLSDSINDLYRLHDLQPLEEGGIRIFILGRKNICLDCRLPQLQKTIYLWPEEPRVLKMPPSEAEDLLTMLREKSYLDLPVEIQAILEPKQPVPPCLLIMETKIDGNYRLNACKNLPQQDAQHSTFLEITDRCRKIGEGWLLEDGATVTFGR